jgi:hypothetical protein
MTDNNGLVAVLAEHGFTTRQAAFLSTVMRHSGLCVQRQYAQHAGIANGQNVREFFGRLTSRGFATAYPCWQRGRLIYHVHHKGLYAAIGEADNRHRRQAIVTRAAERLLLLDAVLSRPDVEWLATEREKVTYCTQQRGLAVGELPALQFEHRGARTTRYFTAKLPVGVSRNSDELVFLYPIVQSNASGVRSFLRDHHALLRRLARWTLLLVAPPNLTTAGEAHVAAVEAFLAAPLRPAVMAEFQWFCAARRASEHHRGTAPGGCDAERYAAARRAFGAPRFYEAYRAWLKHGDAALVELQSPHLHDAWKRGEVRVSLNVLPYRYEHLAPAAAIA